MNLIKIIKNMAVKKTAKATKSKEAKAENEVNPCEVCLGKGRVSDKESCEKCEGTGVNK